MYKSLDPLLNSELRLAIISLLINMRKADFGFLKEKTGATPGNLSIQSQKLKQAEYITIKKSFKGNYPLTTCKITKKGIDAFEEYVKAIKTYITIKK